MGVGIHDANALAALRSQLESLLPAALVDVDNDGGPELPPPSKPYLVVDLERGDLAYELARLNPLPACVIAFERSEQNHWGPTAVDSELFVDVLIVHQEPDGVGADLTGAWYSDAVRAALGRASTALLADYATSGVWLCRTVERPQSRNAGGDKYRRASGMSARLKVRATRET